MILNILFFLYNLFKFTFKFLRRGDKLWICIHVPRFTNYYYKVISFIIQHKITKEPKQIYLLMNLYLSKYMTMIILLVNIRPYIFIQNLIPSMICEKWFFWIVLIEGWELLCIHFKIFCALYSFINCFSINVHFTLLFCSWSST